MSFKIMSGRIGRALCGVILMVVLMSGSQTKAQLSPGKLHKSHVDLEGVENCSKCHIPGGGDMSGQCLTCHTAIRERQVTGSGLHGQPDYQNCVLCHVEHQGRDYNLIYFKGGDKSFDHTRTGYVLQGSHAKLECKECHRPQHLVNAEQLKTQSVNIEHTYLGLGTDCLSCHLDQHREQLGKDCAKCHGFDKWKPAVAFSHDSARFVLTGRHGKVECVKCHPLLTDDMNVESPTYARYRPLNFGNCTDCHKDVHEGRLGSNCTKCHVTSGWKQVQANNFDHDKTRYPLRGKHAAVKCERCHTNENQNKKLAFARCMDCHSDFHNHAFTDRLQHGACEECHTVEGFSPATFRLVQHDSTKYPLLGAHRAIPCVGCHRSGAAGSYHYTFEFASTKCNSCHKDPHKGQVDKFVKADGCEGCHTVRMWDESVFDHQKTKFGLAGKHQTTTCIKCHNDGSEVLTAEHVSFAKSETTCAGCHKDVHGGQFAVAGGDGATNCERCHTPNNWKPTKFDHKRDSRFVLDGAHAKVACVACHKTKKVTADGLEFVAYKPLDTACVTCHAEGTPRGKAEL